MPETKHTALPWHVGGDSEQIWVGPQDDDASVICDIVPRVHGKPPTEEDEANAELIVTAINSHAALLEACKSAESECGMLLPYLSSPWSEGIKALRDALRAAIANAAKAGRAAKGATL